MAVRIIAKNFVPVALNTDRLPKDAVGDFYRALMKRWPQGLWVVAPDGTTLAFHYYKHDPKKNYAQNRQGSIDETLAMLAEGVKAAGELKPRNVRAVNPFPDRGLGLTKEGGARFAATVIGLNRSGKHEGAPAVDSLRLTKAEWAAFVPPKDKTEWAIPESAAKKFAVALAPVTDSIFVPQAKDVTVAEVTAKIIREEAGFAVIRFAGKWESKHFRDGDPKFPIAATASGTGIAVLDRKTGELRSVLFVLNGNYRNGNAVTPTAAVVEWQVEKPTEE